MDEQNQVPVPPPPVAPVANYMQLVKVGGLLSGSWNFYKNHFSTLFPYIVFIFIASCIPLLSVWLSGDIASIIFNIVSVVLTLIASIAIILAIVENGNPVDGASGALSRGAKLFWPYFWAAGLLMGLAITGAFVLLIVPGIIMCIMLVFTEYAVIAEGRRGLNALAYSWHYVKGHGWAVFGRLLVLGLLYIIPLFILSMLFGDFSNSAEAKITIENIPGTLAINFVVALLEPFALMYMFSMYRELKNMKGEMDEATLNSRKKRLMWLTILGIVGALLLVALVIMGIFYFTSITKDPGSTSGVFQFMF